MNENFDIHENKISGEKTGLKCVLMYVYVKLKLEFSYSLDRTLFR